MDPSFPKLQSKVNNLNQVPRFILPVDPPKVERRVVDLSYSIDDYKDDLRFWSKVSLKIDEFFNDDDFHEHHPELEYPDDIDHWIDWKYHECTAAYEDRISAFSKMGDQEKASLLLKAEHKDVTRDVAILNLSRECLKDIVSKDFVEFKSEI